MAKAAPKPQLSPAEDRKAKNRNLAARVATAALAIPGLIALIVWVPKGYGLLAFSLLVSTLAYFEYLKLVQVSPQRPAAVLSLVLIGAIWFGAYSFFDVARSPELGEKTHVALGWVPIVALLVVPALSITLLFDPRTQRLLHTLGVLFVGIFYVAFPFVLFYISGWRLGASPLAGEDLMYPNATYSWYRPMGILVLIWTSDTAQYFAGRFFGRHKLWPRISPAKTWEGAFGGLVCTLALGVGLQSWWPGADLNWIVVAAIIMVFGLLGDLIESAFKRSIQVKDSGGLLPGHGGLLDRFDSFMLAMPILSGYFYWLAVQG